MTLWIVLVVEVRRTWFYELSCLSRKARESWFFFLLLLFFAVVLFLLRLIVPFISLVLNSDKPERTRVVQRMSPSEKQKGCVQFFLMMHFKQFLSQGWRQWSSTKCLSLEFYKIKASPVLVETSLLTTCCIIFISNFFPGILSNLFADYIFCILILVHLMQSKKRFEFSFAFALTALVNVWLLHASNRSTSWLDSHLLDP